MCSPPLMKTPESQLMAEQPSKTKTKTKKNHWNLPKKTPYIQRQRRSHNEAVEGAQS